MKRSAPVEKVITKNVLISSSQLDDYQYERILGDGAHSGVFCYRSRTGQLVAIKEFMEGYAPPEITKSNFMNEVAIMKKLDHENVLRIIDYFSETGNHYLVTELLDYDLSVLIKANKIGLGFHVTKHILAQVLKGLEHIHSLGIIHRDLHVKNVLITGYGGAKVCDFGGAVLDTRKEDGGLLTSQTVFILNRPPEVLFGSKNYECSVDMWSLGCVFAEMPLFGVWDVRAVLKRICKVLGTPTEKEWPGVEEMAYKGYKLPKYNGPIVKNLIPYFQYDSDAYKLLLAMLTPNPKTRVSATDALQSHFIRNIYIKFNGNWNFANVTSAQIKKIFVGNRRNLLSITHKGIL